MELLTAQQAVDWLTRNDRPLSHKRVMRAMINGDLDAAVLDGKFFTTIEALEAFAASPECVVPPVPELLATPPKGDHHKFATIVVAREWLAARGMPLSAETIRRAFRNGKLVGIRRGRSLYVTYESLEQYVAVPEVAATRGVTDEAEKPTPPAKSDPDVVEPIIYERRRKFRG